jgi:fructose-bisphosphate aldolase class I
MNVRSKAPGSRLPWALAFSFARAIQQPALRIWRGEAANRAAAQQALYHRARCNVAARRGEYSAAMEKM